MLVGGDFMGNLSHTSVSFARPNSLERRRGEIVKFHFQLGA